MKAKNERGQVLPLTMLTLLFLLMFVGANGRRVHSGIEKIQNQKTADTLVLAAATEQARALNGIAALNEGLRITLNRVYIFGTALTLLGACAATVVGSAWCLKPFARLSAKTPGFIRKVNQLANAMGGWQDELAVWGARTPYRTLQVFNLERILDAHAFLEPGEPRLRIHRVDEKEFVDSAENKDEAGMASGGDLKTCDPAVRILRPRRGSGDPLEPFRIVHTGESDEVDTVYVSSKDAGTVHDDKLPADMTIVRGGVPYTLDHAVVRTCRSFYGILKNLDGVVAEMIDIPRPYVLDADFFDKQRLAIGFVRYPTDPAFAPLIGKNDLRSLFDNPAWSLSEARILGADPEAMGFEPSLAKVTLDGDLHNSLSAGLGGILGLVLYDQRETHEAIAH